MTLLRPAELATGVIVVWAILGGWALLDAATAATAEERMRDLARFAAWGAVAIAVVWVLAWSAAKARAGT